MLDLSVIILTYNEKLHIERCMKKLLPLFSSSNPSSPIPNPLFLPRGRVFVVDCHSTDGTQEIARSFGAEVVEHAWPGTQAKQFNWALDNLPIQTKWILRLDADEYLYPETIEEVKRVLGLDQGLGMRDQGLGIRDENTNPQSLTTNPCAEGAITSLSLSRARVWMGKRIKRGTGKVILKRFFRTGIGRCEERMMDEHIVTSSGRDYLLKGEFADDNLNDLRWWTEKHLGYAEREACDLLMAEYGMRDQGLGIRDERLGIRKDTNPLSLTTNPQSNPSLGAQAARKRAAKHRYARLPLFWRSFGYFCYRYFLRGGFLEGKAGFTWHFFQGWWYRAMVDARILEIKKACNNDPAQIKAYLESK